LTKKKESQQKDYGQKGFIHTDFLSFEVKRLFNYKIAYLVDDVKIKQRRKRSFLKRASLINFLNAITFKGL